MKIRRAITVNGNGVIVEPIRVRTATILIGHLTRHIRITPIRRYGILSILGFLDTTVRTTDIIEATTPITDTILTRMSIGGITVAVGMSHSRGAPTPTEAIGEVKTDAHEVHGA